MTEGPAASNTAVFGEIDTGLLPPDDWSLPDHIPSSPLLERAATPTRRFRLSRSPLDCLQAEFRRYGLPDRRASPQFAKLPDSSKNISVSPGSSMLPLEIVGSWTRWDELSLALSPRLQQDALYRVEGLHSKG